MEGQQLLLASVNPGQDRAHWEGKACPLVATPERLGCRVQKHPERNRDSLEHPAACSPRHRDRRLQTQGDSSLQLRKEGRLRRLEATRALEGPILACAQHAGESAPQERVWIS
jgi:hypothetical protein